MELAAQLERALAAVCAAGSPEVRENGEWLASLDGLQYEVRQQGDATLLHLWSAQQTLVRRVLRVAQESQERIHVEVARFGRSRPGHIEIAVRRGIRAAGRVGREQFCEKLRHLLADSFPDEALDSLTTAADLQHSLSGSYTRGMMHRGSEAYAVLAAAPEELSATLDGALTFGLIWLELARSRARKQQVAGLRLFLPRGASAAIAHRLAALAAPRQVELYEYDPEQWRLRRMPVSDAGNAATSLVSRREVEAAIASALPEVERIRQLAPEAIRLAAIFGATVASREVALRFRGLDFVRWRDGGAWFGLGERQEALTEQKWGALERLVRQLEVYRHPLSSETRHRYYRAQPERWLEMLVAGDPSRIDPRLDGRYVYTQVPTLSSRSRGIIDVLAVTRDGRLAVLELKAAEDMHLVMQAADYWLRVRWHHQQGDFQRYGYFPGVTLQPKPPLLLLIAPGLRFHPAGDVVLRQLLPEIELTRIGLNEDWRRAPRVLFRKSGLG